MEDDDELRDVEDDREYKVGQRDLEEGPKTCCVGICGCGSVSGAQWILILKRCRRQTLRERFARLLELPPRELDPRMDLQEEEG